MDSKKEFSLRFSVSFCLVQTLFFPFPLEKSPFLPPESPEFCFSLIPPAAFLSSLASQLPSPHFFSPPNHPPTHLFEKIQQNGNAFLGFQEGNKYVFVKPLEHVFFRWWRRRGLNGDVAIEVSWLPGAASP